MLIENDFEYGGSGLPAFTMWSEETLFIIC